ncbi:MAG: hypothetical protein IPN46_14395 [Saprospiraceae bacterium]|nr:hypothetical protein [Saprospiraceae bacterium]
MTDGLVTDPPKPFKLNLRRMEVIAHYPAGIVGECPSPDDESPIFVNCPDGYVFGNDPDQCGAYVNWSLPVADDNCPGVSVSHVSGTLWGIS